MANQPSILIYRNHLLPPSETFVRNQAEALKAFKPHFLGIRAVNGLPLPQERTLVINSGGSWGRGAEIVARCGWFSPALVNLIRQCQPRLIHAHFGQDAATVLPLARSLNLPLVSTFHGYDVTVRDRAAERSLTQTVYVRRRAALQHQGRLFIAVSQFLKNQLLSQGYPAEKVLVHYIGIDPEVFLPDPELPRQPLVLFVGRLVEKKGCTFLIEAMARVQALIPEVELVVIGDGPLRSQLEQMARQRLKRYRFLGVQPPQQVKFWLNRAKVFSVPSITAASGDAEAFGLVFAEAQAMGVPVVSFASGGVPEAVADGETGFLVPERDAQGLAAAIRRLFSDPELWQRFSQQAQQRVRRHFNLHHQTRLLEDIYTERVLDTGAVAIGSKH